jgi:hypothetical protein
MKPGGTVANVGSAAGMDIDHSLIIILNLAYWPVSWQA